MEIQRFIAHVIDHRNSMLELSSVETPVDPNFPHEFFEQYILHALGHNLRRYACFRNTPGRVDQAFRRILDDPDQFVSASREIAGYLYQVMSEGPFSRLINPGDIMVALVEDGDGAERCKGLAILKIDPSEALIRHQVMSEGGPQVLFERRDNRVPNPQEGGAVQKIAVLYERPRTRPERHDLVILDNNIKATKVARFFWDSFLEARLNRDGREVVQVLDDRVKRVVSQQPVAPEAKRKVVSGARQILREGHPLSVRSLARKAVEAAGLNAEDAGSLEAELVRDITSFGRPDERISEDEIVPVDADAAAARSKMLTYVLDGGIQITGPADAMEKRVKIVQSSGRKITVTIQAESLEIA